MSEAGLSPEEEVEANGSGSGSADLGVSPFTLAKTRRPQLGHAVFPSSNRVLHDLHRSMRGSSAGGQLA